MKMGQPGYWERHDQGDAMGLRDISPFAIALRLPAQLDRAILARRDRAVSRAVCPRARARGEIEG